MNAPTKNLIKATIKKFIPTKIIVEAIIKAELFCEHTTGELTGEVKKFLAIGSVFDTLIDKTLPFPLNTIVKYFKTAVTEIIGEIIQEVFNEIKTELKERGPDFILEQYL
jgi:hypothetical protein